MGDISEHFNRAEFACRCGCGLAAIDPALVLRLEAARRLYGRSMTVRSGCRCAAHNAANAGKPESAHLTGRAADVACESSSDRFDMLAAFLKAGFNRIGIGPTFLHVDVDYTKPQSVVWLY